MTDSIYADVEAEARHYAERGVDDRPSAAELADPAPLDLRWCGPCATRHGEGDPWCVKP